MLIPSINPSSRTSPSSCWSLCVSLCHSSGITTLHLQICLPARCFIYLCDHGICECRQYFFFLIHVICVVFCCQGHGDRGSPRVVSLRRRVVLPRRSQHLQARRRRRQVLRGGAWCSGRVGGPSGRGVRSLGVQHWRAVLGGTILWRAILGGRDLLPQLHHLSR